MKIRFRLFNIMGITLLCLASGCKEDATESQVKSTSYSDINEVVYNIDNTTREIVKNTESNFKTDGLNIMGIASIVVAIGSLLVAGITYSAQKKTERHTANAPKSVQLWKLKDLPRHFYRNLVCTCAMILKYKNGIDKRLSYPSEGNMKKLVTLPDDIVLPIDNDNDKDAEDSPYKYMHELRLLLRNYNIEVETASNHLSRKDISSSALNQDFDNLLFKPFFLVYRTFDYEKKLSQKLVSWDSIDNSLVSRTIYCVLSEHFSKLKSNFKNLLVLDKQLVKQIAQKDEVLPGSSIDFDKVLRLIDKDEDLNRSIERLISYSYSSVKDYETLFSEYKELGQNPLIQNEIYVILNKHLEFLKNIKMPHKKRDYNQLKNNAERCKLELNRQKTRIEELIKITNNKDDKNTIIKLIVFISDVIKAIEQRVQISTLIGEHFGICFNSKGTIIDRQRAVDYIHNDFINAVLSVKNEAKFIDFCKNDVGIKKDESFIKLYCKEVEESNLSKEEIERLYETKLQNLYKKIAPYFDYLGKNTQWEFNSLLKYILILDSLIETKNIGMINY